MLENTREYQHNKDFMAFRRVSSNFPFTNMAHADALWSHVIKGAKYESSGAQKWKCKFCDGSYSGTLPRVKAHFSHTSGFGIGPCPRVPQDIFNKLKAWKSSKTGISLADLPTWESIHEGASQSTSKRARASVEIVEESANVSIGEASSTPLRMSGNSNVFMKMHVKSAVQKAAMEAATSEITKLFIQCGLSFNLLRTPQWKKTMRAISRIGCEWEGPKYETLRTRGLRKEKEAVERQLVPLKSTWEKYGCTILCDGWSDVRRRQVYNIMVSSCKGTMFLRAIDASMPGTVITGAFIWSHIRSAIMEIGADNVVQVITDNGSNCVSMGRMLMDEFPKIAWTPCASHSLDLMIEDIGRVTWIHKLFLTASSMVNFVYKRPKVLSMFRANSDYELLKPSKTRFAYMFVVLERVVRVRLGLSRTVMSREWERWDDKNTPKALAFTRMVLKESWWQQAEVLVKVMNPLYSVLRLTDMEGSTIGLLYEFMDKIGESLNTCTTLSDDK